MHVLSLPEDDDHGHTPECLLNRGRARLRGHIALSMTDNLYFIWIQRKCILDGFRQPEYSHQATTYRKCTILDHQISAIGVHISNTLLPLSYQSAVVIMLNC